MERKRERESELWLVQGTTKINKGMYIYIKRETERQRQRDTVRESALGACALEEPNSNALIKSQIASNKLQ